MSQNGPKTTSLVTSLTKICNPQPKKFLYEHRLEDLPNLLRVWTTL